MTSLFDEACRRYKAAAGQDWKAPLARLYVRYERADDEADRRRLEAAILDAFLPMAAFLSMKHARPAIGYAAADAFDAGIVVVPKHIRRFDPERTVVGRRGLLSFLAQYVEWAMIAEERRVAARVDAGVCSLDALDAQDSVPSLADESAAVRMSDVVSLQAAVGRAVGRMGPVDRWIAEQRLSSDPTTWRSMPEAGRREVGVDRSAQARRDRWKAYVRPRLEAAAWAAGYGPEDIGRNDD